MQRVAVVGSGPSGLYAAAALADRDGIAVDVIDRLPAPFGLVRYGVAPDHEKIKTTSVALARVFARPNVRFLGNVELGHDLSLAELQAHYAAVVLAIGAAGDRRLEIEGEDLRGSASATEFVAWYSGHPDIAPDRFALTERSAAVIGLGNVALDVARMLVKDRELLTSTDVPDDVLETFAHSNVREVTIVGRRSPAFAKFTTKELREFGDIPGLEVVVDPADLDLDEAGQREIQLNSAARRNVEVLRSWAERPTGQGSRRLRFCFNATPTHIHGEDRVTGLALRRNGADERLDVELVFRAVGYRGQALGGVPFDRHRGVIPSSEGRVEEVPGLYVAGWIKRGPIGIVGTNKKDANDTAKSVLADLPQRPQPSEADVVDLLAERGVEVVTWQAWQRLEQVEVAAGALRGAPRVKLASRSAMLAATRG